MGIVLWHIQFLFKFVSTFLKEIFTLVCRVNTLKKKKHPRKSAVKNGVWRLLELMLSEAKTDANRRKREANLQCKMTTN